jgi:hypothetical protein
MPFLRDFTFAKECSPLDCEKRRCGCRCSSIVSCYMTPVQQCAATLRARIRSDLVPTCSTVNEIPYAQGVCPKIKVFKGSSLTRIGRSCRTNFNEDMTRSTFAHSHSSYSNSSQLALSMDTSTAQAAHDWSKLPCTERFKRQHSYRHRYLISSGKIP